MRLRQYLLPFFYSLLLPLHIVNSLTIGPGVKLFYIPIAILSLYNVFHFGKFVSNSITKYLLLFGCLAFLPLVFFHAPISGFVIYILTILSLIGLPYIDKKPIYLLTPIFLLVVNVISYRLSDWFGLPYRYQGLYNDPNYLVISMIVGIYLCIRAIESYKNFLVRSLSIVSILVALYVVLLTQSRGGILALLLFILVYIPRLYKMNKKVTIILLLLLIFGSNYTYIRFKDPIDRIVERFFGDRESDVVAASSRFYEIQSAMRGIEEQPFYLIIGAGIGSSGGEDSAYDFERRIHNILIAVLYENGIFALVILLLVFAKQIFALYRTNKLSCALVLAIFLQAQTIWPIIYLPFWLGFFLPIDYMENQ